MDTETERRGLSVRALDRWIGAGAAMVVFAVLYSALQPAGLGHPPAVAWLGAVLGGLFVGVASRMRYLRRRGRA